MTLIMFWWTGNFDYTLIYVLRGMLASFGMMFLLLDFPLNIQEDLSRTIKESWDLAFDEYYAIIESLLPIPGQYNDN